MFIRVHPDFLFRLGLFERRIFSRREKDRLPYGDLRFMLVTHHPRALILNYELSFPVNLCNYFFLSTPLAREVSANRRSRSPSPRCLSVTDETLQKLAPSSEARRSVSRSYSDFQLDAKSAFLRWRCSLGENFNPRAIGTIYK